MKTGFANLSFALSLVILLCLAVFPQEPTPTPSPTPTPPDEPVKVVTEEVKLNVMARNTYGKFVPTLKPDDLLIVEEGTPQTITSMRRVPANVLFLLDTGGELNFVKSVVLTKLMAKIVIDRLGDDDTIAAIQYSDKIETVSDWTKDREAIFESLDKRLFSGKRSRFSDGLNAAVDLFDSRPLENRHLVLISDGLESVADVTKRQNALQNILAANITIHVISYTLLEEQRAKKASQRITLGKGDTKPRVPDYIFDSMLKSLPVKEEVRRFLKTANEAQRIVIVTLDNERVRFIRARRESWRESETRMRELAEDTGGVFHAPEEPVTMLEFAFEVAGAIGSQYVVTYSPTKPVADLPRGETRKVRVGTHCDGVEIRSRQKLILNRTIQPVK